MKTAKRYVVTESDGVCSIVNTETREVLGRTKRKDLASKTVDHLNNIHDVARASGGAKRALGSVSSGPSGKVSNCRISKGPLVAETCQLPLATEAED